MGLIRAIFSRPSQRTLLEAQLAGLSVFLITSIITPIYIIFFSDSALWLKLVTGFGGFALFLMMFSNLSMTYLQYYAFKLQMGLYPSDKKLEFKLEEAKRVVKELNTLINENVVQ